MPLVAPQGDYRGGQKGAIVEMFGWPDADIQAECILDLGMILTNCHVFVFSFRRDFYPQGRPGGGGEREREREVRDDPPNPP